MDTVNAIYVYCDVIEHRTVGHTLTPLIAVLPVTGKPGAYVSKRYDKIQYYPVLKKNLRPVFTNLAQTRLKLNHGSNSDQIIFCIHQVESTETSAQTRLKLCVLSRDFEPAQERERERERSGSNLVQLLLEA